MKQRIRDMAGELIRIAAARKMRDAEIMAPPEGTWDEFCARFPFAETEDQSRAIADVLEDLACGQADGPADLRRCRLRQDRGRAAGRLRRRDVGRSGRRRGADHVAGAPAFPDVLGTVRRAAGEGGAVVAHGARRRRPTRSASAAWPTARSTSSSAPTRCWRSRSSSPISACWSSMRSSISASRTRNG